MGVFCRTLNILSAFLKGIISHQVIFIQPSLFTYAKLVVRHNIEVHLPIYEVYHLHKGEAGGNDVFVRINVNQVSELLTSAF